MSMYWLGACGLEHHHMLIGTVDEWYKGLLDYGPLRLVLENRDHYTTEDLSKRQR
jgi:hypothetical protein